MHNYLLLIVAMFEQHGLVTSSQAEELVKKLESQTLPGDFEETKTLIENLYKRLGISPKAQKVDSSKH